MDDNTFKQFLIVNQILIGKSSITCAACNNWLTPPIHVKNDINYCGQCIPKKSERMMALEEMLSNHKYPCINDNCDYLLDYNEIIKHANHCHQTITCILCKADCDKRKISEHLITEHCAESIVTDKPKHTFTITLPLYKTNLYLVEMYNKQFIFLCFHEGNALCGTLMTLTSDKVMDVDKYAMRITTNMGKTSIHEDVLQQFDATSYSIENIIVMYVGNADSCELELSLGLQQITDTPECPICMHAIDSKLRQCLNGHNVCEECGSKIDKCPICRENILDQVINVQRLYPDAMWPCRNQKNGCMAYFKSTEDKQHLDICPFRNVKCCACTRMIKKCDLITHMRNEHVLLDNFDVFADSLSAESKNASFSTYIVFDSEVFECCITSDENNIEFACEMANSKGLCSREYHFEFHIIAERNDTKAMHVISDVVFTDNNVHSISWRKLRQFTSPVFVRCCIFKVYSLQAIPDVDVNDGVKSNDTANTARSRLFTCGLFLDLVLKKMLRVKQKFVSWMFKLHM